MAPSGYGAPSDEDTAYTNMNDFGQEPAYGAPQMPGRHEGTQTLDIDDLQEVDDFASDYDEGYSAQESTQFVDLNQLAAGAPAAPSSFAAGPGAPGAGAMSPLQDPLLTQSYAFTQESIQTYGNSTLIFTRNQQGQDVVLKRIWQGVSTQMPDDIRQRLTTLSQMHHPHLARLNGVLDSHSGCWAELERPPGQRLSYILSNGPQGRPDIALWAYPTADAIQYIHQFSILYKNLTPDAIWIDEQTRTILLEPFDLLAFEDRGNLGPYGPPELQQPAGTYPVTPATDVYSFAAVIVAALTGVPDPDQVGRIEFQSLKNELVKSLELNPTLRPTEFEPILKVLGPRIDLNPEAKKGFDKRLLIPIVLIVALLGFILFSGGDSPKKITYRQEGLPALQEGAEVVAKAPGALDEIPEVTVIQSYRYAPPEKVDPEPATDVDISEHVEKIKKHITDSKKFNKSEAEVEYKNALKLLQDIHVAQGGKLTPEQQEAYDMAMADKGFRAFRRTLIEKVEERLLPRDEKGFTPNFEESKLPYQALSIDPYAKGREFFLGNKKAQIVSITAEPPRAQKEDKTDTKEKAPLDP